MIIDKHITGIVGKYDFDSQEVTVEYSVISDEWRDGPLAIGIQGTADRILDGDGNVKGWLPGGSIYRFGNEIDARIVASAVEVSERKIIDADEEYEIRLHNGGVMLRRNTRRIAIVRWKARQTFKRRKSENQDPEEDQPSVNDPFTLRCSREFVESPFLRDVRTGELIVNSAGEPFTPTPTMQRAIRAYSLTRKERANPLAKADLYENVVNSDEWYGAKPGTLLLVNIDPEWDGNIWTVTYNYKYKADGWGDKFLDTGLKKKVVESREIVDETNTAFARIEKATVLYPVLGKAGTDTQEPVKLDGNGYVPVRRKNVTKNPVLNPLTDEPAVDPDTGETLYWEEGDPLRDGKGEEIPINGFPGIDIPLDEYKGNGAERKLVKRNYFWKFKELPFADLNMPNPYKVVATSKELEKKAEGEA